MTFLKEQQEEAIIKRYTSELFEKLKDDSIYEDGKEWLTKLIKDVRKDRGNK